MKTHHNKNKLRVQKTKKQLEEALGLLLEEKSFEDIRVIDICEKANMHRSTFYTYYNDKYELLKSKLDEYESKFLEYLNKYKIEDKLKDSHIDIMIKILQYFYHNRKLYYLNYLAYFSSQIFLLLQLLYIVLLF